MNSYTRSLALNHVEVTPKLPKILVVFQLGKAPACRPQYPSTLRLSLLARRQVPARSQILAFSLVDPNVRIVSTANVPPLREDWWKKKKQVVAQVLRRPPLELQDMVTQDLDATPITMDEAKRYRLEPMEERKGEIKNKMMGLRLTDSTCVSISERPVWPSFNFIWYNANTDFRISGRLSCGTILLYRGPNDMSSRGLHGSNIIQILLPLDLSTRLPNHALRKFSVKVIV